MPSDRPVLIDTDTGVDDALALLTVLASAAVNVVGIGSSYGNCPVDLAARNACCVLEVAGRAEIPVATGLAQPADSLVSEAAGIHGHDGLGNRSWTPSVSPGTHGAVEQLLRLSHEHAGRLELLVLGPLTNIAAALAQDPMVLTRCASVVIMGGMGHPERIRSITRAYPNYPVVGDPNTWHNPAAAEAVVAARGPITWVGMDVTGRIRLPETLLTAPAERWPRARFIATITEYYCDFVTRTSESAQRVFTIHDSIAANVLLDPGIAVAHTETTLVLDRDRDPRGAVWADPSPENGRPRHRLVSEIDLPAVLTRLTATVSA